ncbi:MAG: hypothetical protein DDT32_01945 [Syntrophomonadaceae bacterium]|nr:hypothetical protein [Bacillota bacterium]MBT9148175.1 hypothetical protein [Bacillota bacterium]
MFVPVVDSNQKPLMPAKISRVKRWIKSGKATPFWKKGVFCVRLNVEPSSRELQPITVGIDPGSKKEAFTVKSEAHTYLNIQADAVTHVSKAVEVRKNMRKARRFRNTPCRQNRMNRKRGGIPPSTKARWGWKLRICNWLAKLYPIVAFVVEDIKAKTKGKRRWDASFSPLEVGKAWFYKELGKLGHLETRQGYETKEMRDSLGLKKIGNKLSTAFEAHCVDSWVLANWWVGGHTEPDNKEMLLVTPLRFHRRQLHKLQPEKGGARSHYGSTNSLGFKRGSLVKHLKRGLCYVGGFMKDRISLHSVETGERLCRDAKPKECKFLTYSSWRCRNSPIA